MSTSPHGTGPRVSVVLSTYRRQAVLPRAITSVAQQTYANWELLVVDDEPSDETAAIVSAFDDPRIRYLAHDRNRGLCAARNTGLRAAVGDYIAFLDDDDEFLPRKLELQVAALDAAPYQTAVVSCFEEVVRLDGSPATRSVVLTGNVHAALQRQDLVRMQLLLVRRSCFEHVGPFDERLRTHDDFDMTLRLSRAHRFLTVAEPLVRIIETPNSMSTSTHHRIEALETLLATHADLREPRRIRARWERRLARHHGELGNKERWRRMMLASLRSHPLSASGWAVWLVGELAGPAVHLRLGKVRGRVMAWGRARRGRP